MGKYDLKKKLYKCIETKPITNQNKQVSLVEKELIKMSGIEEL